MAGRLTWRGTEAFLGAGVHAVHLPVVSKEGDASQAADCVHDQQGALLVAQLPQPSQALMYASAALTLHHTDMHTRQPTCMNCCASHAKPK